MMTFWTPARYNIVKLATRAEIKRKLAFRISNIYYKPYIEKLSRGFRRFRAFSKLFLLLWLLLL